MEPKDLPHLKVYDKGVMLTKIVEVAEVIFKGGRTCNLYVLGIQKGRAEHELNLVHALNYDLSTSKIYDYMHLRNAMLEEISCYTPLTKTEHASCGN